MERAFFYIDGFNLYYGMKEKKWKKYYWLNLQKLCEIIIKPFNQNLEGIKFFTARISDPHDKVTRQNAYLEALETLDKLEIIEGIYHKHTITCKFCKQTYCCACGHKYVKNEEKRTDVNIAVNLLDDGFKDKYDIAYLISGDSDLVPVLEKFKNSFPGKKIIVCFPPKRVSKELQKASSIYRSLYRPFFRDSQFPPSLINIHGKTIHRPPAWSK